MTTESGKVDVLIGTHRLLSPDVRFKDVGLLVVDEEQRFGVTHKERLKKLRTSVDVLTMTATPIPRTLEMALSGIREMSTVDTPPEDRQPVLTYVGPFDEDMALAAVRRELLRGGQVFWVHNRVETIERRAAELRAKLGEEARVVVAHGQMDEERLEKVMLAFWDRTRGRPGVHDDHRERARRAERQHAGGRAGRPPGPGPAVSAAGTRGAIGRPGVRLPLLPAAGPADGGGARTPGGHQPVHRARERVLHRHAGPRDPRRGEPARGRAARAHRRGGVRYVPPAPGGGGRRR